MWVDGERVKLVRTPRSGGVGDTLEPEAGSEFHGRIKVWEYFAADGSQGSDMRHSDPSNRQYSDDYWDEVDGNTVWGGEPGIDTHSQRDGSGGAAEPFQTSYPPWTTDHRVIGRSWAYVRLTQTNYGDDTGKRFWSREPNIEFLVKGIKITWPGQATAKWTRNRAALYRWFLTERMGYAAADIHSADFTAALAYCGEDVTATGLTQQQQTDYAGWDLTSMRYPLDYVLSSAQEPEDVLDDFNSGMGGGAAVEAGGKVHIRPGRDRAASAHITASDIIERPAVQPWRPIQDRINAVDVVLEQSSHDEHDWQETAIGTIEDAAAITRDKERRTASLRLPGITDPIAGGRLAAILLRESRESMRMEVAVRPRADLSLMGLIPTDTVTVTLDEFALSAFKFRVEGVLVRDDWSVLLTLREDHADTYAATLHLPALDARALHPQAERHAVPDVAGLSLSEVDVVAKDGSTVTVLLASWTAAAAFETRLAIRRKTGADTYSSWRYETARGNTHTFAAIGGGETYQVRAQHVSALGYRGDWSANVSLAITGDAGAPAQPTAIASTRVPEGFRLDWTNPADEDLAAVEIEYGTTPSGTTKTVSVSSTFAELLGLSASTQYRYRLRAVDRTGNASAWTSWANVTTGSALQGADGTRVFVVYKRASTKPSSSTGTYSNSTFTPPTGWTIAIPDGTDQLWGQFQFVEHDNTVTSGGVFRGEGTEAEDGRGYEYIFTLYASSTLPVNRRPNNSWG